jgi:hypothetical protein
MKRNSKVVIPPYWNKPVTVQRSLVKQAHTFDWRQHGMLITKVVILLIVSSREIKQMTECEKGKGERER